MTERTYKELDDIVNKSPAVAFLWRNSEGWPVEFVTDNIKQFGYLPSEFLSGKISYAEIVHKDDLERVAEEVLNHSESGVNEFTQEYRIYTKEGKTCWIDDRTWIRRNIKGEITHYQGIILDIIERKFLEENLKKSEEKYRLISENANDLISVFNDKFKFEFVNEKIHKDLMGYNKEDLIGTIGLKLIHPDDQQIVAQEFKRLIEIGEGGAIARIKQKSGTYLWTETKGTPFKDLNGNQKLLLITRDISERKQAELKLKESEEKYREAYNRAEFYKDLFAHDISNILQNILSAMELSSLLLNNPENLKDIQTNLNVIKDQVNRGAMLVSNVRKLSQLEEYKKSIKPIEIMNTIRNSIIFTKNSYRERDIDIRVDSISKEVYIQANDLIQDVFENILINAVKHNINPKVEIIVKFSKEELEDIKYLKIEFIDNGVGIENVRKDTIFQRAYNEDKSVSGMGLGLSLVKKIIESFNGKIWVEDKVEGDHSKGSNFNILIPVKI